MEGVSNARHPPTQDNTTQKNVIKHQCLERDSNDDCSVPAAITIPLDVTGTIIDNNSNSCNYSKSLKLAREQIKGKRIKGDNKTTYDIQQTETAHSKYDKR
jgi:hypothetical protein